MQLKSYCGFDLRVFPITSIATIRKKIPKSRIVLLIILKNVENPIWYDRNRRGGSQVCRQQIRTVSLNVY